MYGRLNTLWKTPSLNADVRPRFVGKLALPTAEIQRVFWWLGAKSHMFAIRRAGSIFLLVSIVTKLYRTFTGPILPLHPERTELPALAPW
jgi:hypothetical protein